MVLDMKIRIRKFRESDMHTILELEKNFPPKSRQAITEEEALELYNKNPNACLVAEIGWKVSGAIFGEVHGDACKIRSLIIDVDKLGEDIGTLLIDELLKSTNTKRVLK